LADFGVIVCQNFILLMLSWKVNMYVCMCYDICFINSAIWWCYSGYHLYAGRLQFWSGNWRYHKHMLMLWSRHMSSAGMMAVTQKVNQLQRYQAPTMLRSAYF